jgi:hypothetical protein
MDSDDRLANIQTFHEVIFSFTTQSLLHVGGNISVLLPTRFFSGKSNPIGVLNAASGNAVLGSCHLANVYVFTSSWLQIDCAITNAALEAGVHSIVFAAGEFITGPAVVASGGGLKIKTSTDASSIGVITPALAGVTNVSMMLASLDQFAFQTSTRTVSFFFTTMKPIRANAYITVTLPAQYFTGKSNPVATIILVSGSPLLSTCSLSANILRILCPISLTAAAGSFTLNFAPGELTVGSVFKLIGYKGAEIIRVFFRVCLIICPIFLQDLLLKLHPKAAVTLLKFPQSMEFLSTQPTSPMERFPVRFRSQSAVWDFSGMCLPLRDSVRVWEWSTHHRQVALHLHGSATLMSHAKCLVAHSVM